MQALSNAPRGRKADLARSLPSAELLIWKHYAKRFRETYRSRTRWDGELASWPVEGNPHANGLAPWDGTLLPSGRSNSLDLARLARLANGDAAEACARIDRAFASPALCRLGVSIGVVANWFETLRSDETLSARVAQVFGRGA